MEPPFTVSEWIPSFFCAPALGSFAGRISFTRAAGVFVFALFRFFVELILFPSSGMWSVLSAQYADFTWKDGPW